MIRSPGSNQLQFTIFSCSETVSNLGNKSRFEMNEAKRSGRSKPREEERTCRRLSA